VDVDGNATPCPFPQYADAKCDGRLEHAHRPLSSRGSGNTTMRRGGNRRLHTVEQPRTRAFQAGRSRSCPADGLERGSSRSTHPTDS
jgi:hypothetical protein